MSKTENTVVDDAGRQDALTDERATAMPMHHRYFAEFRPNSFIDRSDYDEPWSDPMIGSRFLERRKPQLD